METSVGIYDNSLLDANNGHNNINDRTNNAYNHIITRKEKTSWNIETTPG
jgi:hypothetical protein